MEMHKGENADEVMVDESWDEKQRRVNIAILRDLGFERLGEGRKQHDYSSTAISLDLQSVP